MRRIFVFTIATLWCTSASSLQIRVQKEMKVGTGCIGLISTVAPKLGTCTIAGAKTRIWCPNGEIFDYDEERPAVSLVRSVCNLSQIP